MYAWPKFHGSSPYSFRENDLNAKKFMPPPLEKQYILVCLASATQARQKINNLHFFPYKTFVTKFDIGIWVKVNPVS